MPFSAVAATYLLSVCAVLLTMRLHLVPAVFAGLAVHVLTTKLARQLPNHWGGMAHKVALAALMVIVILVITVLSIAIWAFMRGHHGMADLLNAAADVLLDLRRKLPEDLATLLPENITEARDYLANLLQEHSQRLSVAGIAGAKNLAHLLMGMVVGGMTAIHNFEATIERPAFSAALHTRTQNLATAFDKVVFAQVKISALNTFLTAVYLLVVLPLAGIKLPLLSVLIPFTFLTGLLPVVGNLISNTAIVLISLGNSPTAAVASLIFLVVIHKLEYFVNAKIVGGEVQAYAWEMLCAMLVMEAAFGISGFIVAPVAYAWLKTELRAAGMLPLTTAAETPHVS